MKAIKNYGKKTKLWTRIAVSIKTLSLTIGGSVYFSDNKDAAFIVLMVGAVCNEVINILGSDDFILRKNIDENSSSHVN